MNNNRIKQRSANLETNDYTMASCSSLDKQSDLNNSETRCLRKATHKTCIMRIKVAEVPSLADLAIINIADHSDSLSDVSCLPEMVTLQLLKEIMRRQKLTFSLAKTFMDCGHDDIARAMKSLKLFDAVPTGKHSYPRYHSLT